MDSLDQTEPQKFRNDSPSLSLSKLIRSAMASASDPRSGTSTPSVLVAVPWTRRRLRANDVLGTCIPLLLLLLAFTGYRLVVFQVGTSRVTQIDTH
jgi:hypothetical protein